MGDVIYFDFRSREDAKKSKKTESFGSEFEDKTEKTVRGNKLIQRGRFLSLSSRNRELSNLIASLDSLSRFRKTIENRDTDELIDCLEKSHERNWREKPAFYKAVFEELKHRLIE